MLSQWRCCCSCCTQTAPYAAAAGGSLVALLPQLSCCSCCHSCSWWVACTSYGCILPCTAPLQCPSAQPHTASSAAAPLAANSQELLLTEFIVQLGRCLPVRASGQLHHLCAPCVVGKDLQSTQQQAANEAPHSPWTATSTRGRVGSGTATSSLANEHVAVEPACCMSQLLTQILLQLCQLQHSTGCSVQCFTCRMLRLSPTLQDSATCMVCSTCKAGESHSCLHNNVTLQGAKQQAPACKPPAVILQSALQDSPAQLLATLLLRPAHLQEGRCHAGTRICLRWQVAGAIVQLVGIVIPAEVGLVPECSSSQTQGLRATRAGLLPHVTER